MAEFSLTAQTRTVFGKKNRELRDRMMVPAVVYGHGTDNLSVSVSAQDFKKVLFGAGKSSLVDLKVDDKSPSIVLIHDVQRDPVSDEPIHVDFYHVNMNEKLTADVRFIFEGEAPAVKEHGGVLVKARDIVTVECLPKNLIHEIQVDISVLKNFDDIIRISELDLPDGIEVVGDPDMVVISAQPPRKEEEEAVVVEEEEAGVEGVEVEKKGKKGEEGEESKEGGEGDSHASDKPARGKDAKVEEKK